MRYFASRKRSSCRVDTLQSLANVPRLNPARCARSSQSARLWRLLLLILASSRACCQRSAAGGLSASREHLSQHLPVPGAHSGSPPAGRRITHGANRGRKLPDETQRPYPNSCQNDCNPERHCVKQVHEDLCSNNIISLVCEMRGCVLPDGANQAQGQNTAILWPRHYRRERWIIAGRTRSAWGARGCLHSHGALSGAAAEVTGLVAGPEFRSAGEQVLLRVGAEDLHGVAQGGRNIQQQPGFLAFVPEPQR